MPAWRCRLAASPERRCLFAAAPARFFIKATNAQNAGAAAVVLYNNIPLSPEH